MKKNERTVYFYDLSIIARSRSFEAPKPISVRKAFDLIKLIPEESRVRNFSNGQEEFYISDWRWDEKEEIACILINKSDKDLSDPIFTDPTNRKRRVVEKMNGEGQDFSIHAVIKFPKDTSEPAVLLLEHCNGLGVSVLKRLLNGLLKDAKSLEPASYEQNHPDGSRDENGKSRKYKVNFTFGVAGHPSSDFINDLNRGKVDSIELITETKRYNQIDQEGYIKEKCQILSVTLSDSEGLLKDKATKVVNFIKNKKADFGKARIKFKTESGLSRTVEMSTEDGLASQYVKKEKIEGFVKTLDSSYEKINDQILSKMKVLFK